MKPQFFTLLLALMTCVGITHATVQNDSFYYPRVNEDSYGEMESFVRVTLLPGSRTADSISGTGILYTSASSSSDHGYSSNEMNTDEFGITGYKIKSSGKHVGIILSGKTLQAGDVVNIYTTKNSDVVGNDGLLHLYSDKGTTPLANIPENENPGLHSIELGSEADGVSAVYLYRVNKEMNPYVAYMEIVRYRNEGESKRGLLEFFFFDDNMQYQAYQSDIHKIVLNDSTATIISNKGDFLFVDGDVNLSKVVFSTESFPPGPSGYQDVIISPLHIYPNPTQNLIHIEGTKQGGRVQIVSLDGYVIKSTHTKDSETIIEVQDLSAGTYLLQINNQVVKFIKH